MQKLQNSNSSSIEDCWSICFIDFLGDAKHLSAVYNQVCIHDEAAQTHTTLPVFTHVVPRFPENEDTSN